MTDAELQRVKSEIIATSAYYQVKLEQHVIQMYAEDLSDLPLEIVLEGYKRWRKNPKNFRNPLPAHIRSMFDSTVTDDDKANDVAARITTASARIGRNSPAEARKYIGELGWKVVQRQGGWDAICERLVSETPTYQAQYARLAKAIMHSAESGEDGPPQLPAADNAKLSYLKNILLPQRPENTT